MLNVDKSGELLFKKWLFGGSKKVIYPLDFLLRKKSIGSRKGILPLGFSLRENPFAPVKIFEKGIMVKCGYGFYS